MDIREQDIEKLAELARIDLTSKQKERFAKQISLILDYVDQIKKVDTSAVGDMDNLSGLKNVFRRDQAEDYPDKHLIIGQFPERAGNLNKTKGVFDK